MYLIISALWLIWEIKYILFWLYLWQLKDYHIGRFIDHFGTHKGAKLLFKFEQIAKLVLLIFLAYATDLFNFLFSIIFLIYLAEFLIFLRGIFVKSAKKPVKTLKIVFLSLISFAVAFLFLIWNSNFENRDQIFWLLAFDIVTPLVVSAVIFMFQPIFVAGRDVKVQQAGYKIDKIKSVSGLKVVAITGSFGKTTTKEFLAAILSRKFRVLATEKNQNSEIGIARRILNDLKPNHQIFVAEVGAYNKGKVEEVCHMLGPKIGIVTGVNEQHLSLFGSLDNLLSAEGGRELAAILPSNGILILNGDNKYCLNLYKEDGPKLSPIKKLYKLSNKEIDSDIWADGISVHKNKVEFLAIDKSGEIAHFDASVLGKQNVQNLLAAILAAKELGMNFSEIAEACKEIKPEQAGMVLRREKHGIEVIDSSYSANPDGVFADLDYLSIFSGKKVIVMPCLIELGKKSAEIHEKIGGKIGEICDLAIITSKDKFKKLKQGAMEAGMAERDILLCDNPREIYSAITLFCKSGDAVLLEGRVPAELINLLK